MEETILTGHTSPETAFVVNDYPYGFTLRCKIRYWLEYKPNHGYRLVSQTTNPKFTTAEIWNAPKPSTYRELAVMVQLAPNLKGIREVSWHGLSVYTVREDLEPWIEKYGVGLDENGQRIVAAYRAAIKRYNEMKAQQEVAAQ